MKLLTRNNLIVGFVLLALLAAVLWGAEKIWKPAPANLSEPLRRDKIIESVYGIGTVKANRRFLLKPGVTSTVSAVYVKEGDAVVTGQKLLELEGKVLFSAPFDGTVTSLPVKVGENVFAQAAVLELVDLLDRYVTVALEQRAAIRVNKGQQARLSFENLRDTAYSGVVESVYSSGSDFLVRIEVRDLPPQILPGMTADVAIGVNQQANALLVPVSAIEDGRVFVQRGSQEPFQTNIQIGIVDGAYAEVVSGNLEPGDRVALPSEPKPS